MLYRRCMSEHVLPGKPDSVSLMQEEVEQGEDG